MSEKGTSLGLLNAQLTGSGENKNTQQEYFPATKESPYTAPTIVGEYLILKLVKKIGRGNVNIDGVCDVLNPTTGKVERARLLSGIDTIWLKEQKDLTKEYIDQNRRSLKFEDGICRIPKDDTSAIEYATIHNGFVDNPKRRTGSRHEFFAWNPERMADERLKKRMFKLEAMKKAMECPFEDMKKHAIYLGIMPTDEFGIPKNEQYYRDEYILKAEENPTRFMETFGSKLVEITFMVRKALMDAKIDCHKEIGKIYFSTGKFICSIPSGRKPQEVLIEFASSGMPEAQTFLDDLTRTV
jgi:hypothetical protein